MITLARSRWLAFELARPTAAQFVVFVVLNVGMTVLQLVMMPVLKAVFGATSLVGIDFQALPVGTAPDGAPFFVFDYAAGALPDGGGGLAYFLAVQLTLAIAQVINFFAQRTLTFKSNSDPWRAAAWYAVAYVVITFGAAALQSVYKAPIYELFITTWGWGATGEAAADVTTMLINAVISCLVFFPVFKIIFRREPEPAPASEPASESPSPRSLQEAGSPSSTHPAP